jgi:GDP-L-fucose synthase
VFDASKPDGTPRKLLDVSKLEGMGWKASIALEEGIRATYRDFLDRYASMQPTPVAA